MKWHERLAMVRRYGPPSPTLRHVLEVLVSYDSDEGRFVWPGNERLARETGLTGRCIRASLAALVRAGWLLPEKPARESRPADAAGREAWWAHGNLGGRTNSTRYRITYQAETRNDVPPKPGTTFRHADPSPAETRNDVPQTRNDVPLNPERRSGDPSRSIHDPREGDTPLPTPHPGGGGDAGASPLAGAVAPGLPAAARHAIQRALGRERCHITDTPSLEAWEGIMATIGVADEREVARVIYDLTTGWAKDHGAAPVRPYLAADLAPYVPAARRSLDAVRALKSRMRNTA